MRKRFPRASRSTACCALALALASSQASASPYPALLSRLSLTVSPELSLPLTEGQALGPGGGSGLESLGPRDGRDLRLCS
ncbi:MAG TPA: hypothetical protein PLB91_01495 [Spirochaetales bacterium]|nr:hypothetical protein [Spirochaetales bacterium]HRY54230.1 hypothetical protein [Spirochaetia bacterium]HRZ64877.1 hypothetical protein [Spirochaetia bacterium]